MIFFVNKLNVTLIAFFRVNVCYYEPIKYAIKVVRYNFDSLLNVVFLWSKIIYPSFIGPHINVTILKYNCISGSDETERKQLKTNY
jgi:hypothetical protein